ncbi:hypothetical protein [Amycolatopsis sp. cmx-4-54]|uniref:hypothetical protein n=1 Tax=Amycolatopsis sp. cmx-4-54 TaxID=2790936 RepID=UPI0039790D65
MIRYESGCEDRGAARPPDRDVGVVQVIAEVGAGVDGPGEPQTGGVHGLDGVAGEGAVDRGELGSGVGGEKFDPQSDNIRFMAFVAAERLARVVPMSEGWDHVLPAARRRLSRAAAVAA